MGDVYCINVLSHVLCVDERCLFFAININICHEQLYHKPTTSTKPPKILFFFGVPKAQVTFAILLLKIISAQGSTTVVPRQQPTQKSVKPKSEQAHGMKNCILWFCGSRNFAVADPSSEEVRLDTTMTRWWQLTYFLFSPLFGEIIYFD